jgi:hypothetical protein
MRNGEYVDGKKDGLWVSYYANGNKQSEGTYLRDQKEGRWVQYLQNPLESAHAFRLKVRTRSTPMRAVIPLEKAQ